MEIQKIRCKELKTVLQFYREISSDLRQKGIQQWDRYYPNRFIVKSDLKEGNLYGILSDNHLVGAVVVDTNQSKKYRKLYWEDEEGNPLVIHRLAVHPLYQGKGYGKRLLHFAEEFARLHEYTSIRLDVFSVNDGAVKMYERAGYQDRGTIHFPFRSAPYICYEKIMGGD
ncbi:GNAT family N-acetyltransferase [Neobacillus vireti]|uniref:GNAT family N-acetyltransferase n=1 Tax=Neobacillus vireti TaxID=220686 RepID=UPI003000A7A4